MGNIETLCQNNDIATREKIASIRNQKTNPGSINEIIELARYSGVEISPFELYNSTVDSYKGLNLGKTKIALDRLKGKDFSDIHMIGGEIFGNMSECNFSGARLYNLAWDVRGSNVNFSNTYIKDSRFLDFEIPYLDKPSSFSGASIVGGTLANEFRIFNCDCDNISTNDSAPVPRAARNFEVERFSPKKHFICQEGTRVYTEGNTDNVKLFRLNVLLDDGSLPVDISYSKGEAKMGLVFLKDNYDFGEIGNIVMRDCYYDINTDMRPVVKKAIETRRPLDLKGKVIRLRFTRPTFGRTS